MGNSSSQKAQPAAAAPAQRAPQQPAQSSTVAAIQKMRGTINTMEKRINFLEKKQQNELKSAMAKKKAGNKSGEWLFSGARVVRSCGTRTEVRRVLFRWFWGKRRRKTLCGWWLAGMADRALAMRCDVLRYLPSSLPPPARRASVLRLSPITLSCSRVAAWEAGRVKGG